MSVVTKLSSYGFALFAGFAIALALLVGAQGTTEAAAGAVTLGVPAGVPANSTGQTLITTDADIVGTGQFIIASIDASSTGTANFAASGGQSVVCIDGDAACDLAGAGVITVAITGTGTPGTVVVNVRLVDGGDGLDALGDDSDIETVAYNQTAVATALTLYAGNAATGGEANGSAIPASPTATVDQVVLAARITTGSNTTAAVVPGAGNTINFFALPGSSGIFGDSTGAAPATAQAIMPTTWNTAAGVAGPTVQGAANTAAAHGCASGAGSQICSGTTEVADGAAAAETAAQATAAVVFEGGGIAGTATLQASFGSLSSNTVTVTLFGAAASATVDVSTGSSSRIASIAGATSVTVTVVDANGFAVAGHTPIVRISSATSAANALTIAATGPAAPLVPGTTDGNGQATFSLTAKAAPGTPTGTQVVEVLLAGGTTVQDSENIEIVGAVSSLTVTDSPASVEALARFSVTVSLMTADDVAALNGTAVVVAATGSGVVEPGQTLTTVDGDVTINLRAEDLAGQIVVIIADAATGLISDTATITVTKAGNPPPDTSGEGTFDRAIASVGINTAVWNGGTLAQLSAATAAANGTSVTVFVDGAPVTHIPGAPDFVNAAFSAAFPDGAPAGTIVLVAVIQ